MIEDNVLFFEHYIYTMIYYYFSLPVQSCYGMFELLLYYRKCLFITLEAISSANVFKFLGMC